MKGSVVIIIMHMKQLVCFSTVYKYCISHVSPNIWWVWCLDSTYMYMHFALTAYDLIFLWIRKWLRYRHSWLQINVLFQPITWKHPSPRTLMHAGNYCLLLKCHFNNNFLYKLLNTKLYKSISILRIFIRWQIVFQFHFNHYLIIMFLVIWREHIHEPCNFDCF